MKVKVKRLHPNAIIPKYATEGAACFDISALVEMVGETVSDSALFRTGLAFEVPADHVMLVFSRSGHGFKNNTRLSNCVGVIDSDYRGELMVKLKRDTFEHAPVHVEHGDRIAQAMVIPVQQVEFEEVETLGETKRGTNGLGSTGQGA